MGVQYSDGNLGCGTSGQPLGCLWAGLNGSPRGPGGKVPLVVMEIMRVWVSEVETAGTPLPSHLGRWTRRTGKAEGPSRDHTPADFKHGFGPEQ